jgi:multiple sugar transport system substrate-binding protein
MRLWPGTVLALAALAGCHRAEEADGKTTIRLSGYVSSPSETGLMRRLVEEFNAAHPDIRVKYEPVPGQYLPKLLTMLVSKTAPDVFYLDIVDFKPLLSKRVLRPLNAYLAGSTTRPADFHPALMRAFSDGGAIYGIPKDFNAMALFYNKASFDQARLGYPDASWTLDTFREAAKRLTVSAGSTRRYGFALTHDNADRYLPIANMFGASLFGPDGRCGLGTPAAIQAMDYYSGLKLKDGAAIYPGEVGSSWTGDAFGRGDAAMAFEGGWLIPYLRDSFPALRYGVAELPKGPAGRSDFLFTVSYAIPRSATHPEAAWKLIEHLTSEAAQARVDFALPSRKAAIARYVARHPEYRAIVAGAGYARPYDFGPKGDRVKNRLGGAVQEVFLGTKSSAQALTEAAADIDRIMKL